MKNIYLTQFVNQNTTVCSGLNQKTIKKKTMKTGNTKLSAMNPQR